MSHYNAQGAPLRTSQSALRNFITILFFFLGATSLLWAQSPPVTAWFTPEEFESGDELTLHIHMGTEENPVENVTSLSFEVEYEGFDIVSDPYIDTRLGWFAADGRYEGSITVDNEARSITVELTRTDDRPVSGHGEVMRGKGIAILMDDIQKSKSTNGIVNTEVKNLEYGMPVWGLYYSSSLQALEVMGLESEAIETIRVMDMLGRPVARQEGQLSVLQAVLPKNQVLIVQVDTTEGTYSRRVWIQ